METTTTMSWLLPLLIALPAAGALIACLVGNDAAGQRRFGVAWSLLTAAFGTALLCTPVAPFSVPWFSLWGTGATVHLALASDGLSAWLVQLAGWLTPLAILGAGGIAAGRMRAFVVCVLAMQALMIGALLARDLVLFLLCYEGMLVPMIAIIALFGAADRRDAALRFFLFTAAGSVAILAATWWLAAKLHTTDLAALAAGIDLLSGEARGWLFWAFVLAFAVKVPLVPLHGWQAPTYEQTPGAGVALLGGVMAKVGLFGLIALTIPLFPEEAARHATLFIVLGVIGCLGGALAAIVQDNAKAMIAYSSLSHLGLVVAGVFTFQTAALHGAAVQMVAHGLSLAALFLLIGAMEARTRLSGLHDFGSLAGIAPRFAVLFVTAALATAGLPGTLNFVGEFLLLIGLYQHGGLWLAGAAGLSVILTVVYLLILVQRWLFGEQRPATDAPIEDLGPAEVAAVAPLLAAALVLGFWSTPIQRSAGAAADRHAAEARAALAAPPAAIRSATSASTP